MVEEFYTHEQSGLIVHTQSLSLAWAFAFVDVVVELELSSLDVPKTNATYIHLHYGVYQEITLK
jgi:hypothetical protein